MGERSRSALVAMFAAIALTVTIPTAARSAEPNPPEPPTAVAARAPEPRAPEADMQLVAHRAAAGGAPEQTAAAMRRAVRMRPDHIEIDVQLSSDGVPVLVHDRTFARTTDVEQVFPGRGDDPVGSFSHQQIRRLDAGSWFGERFAGERIPTLASVPRFVDGTGVGVFLELKNPDASPGLEKAVDAVLDDDYRWKGIEVTFLSFDASSLHRMAELRPQPLLWLNPDVPSSRDLDRLADWADELGVDYRRLTDADVDRVHSAGLRLAVYTVNSRSAQRWVRSIGVDTLVTDFPERVRG